MFAVANWKARKALIEYCIGVVDGSVDEKAQELDSPTTPDEAERAQSRVAITPDRVKVSSYNFRTLREKSVMISSANTEKANPSGAVCGTHHKETLIGRYEPSTTHFRPQSLM